MAIALTCAECEHDLRVKDELAGRTIKCPECGGAIEVPAGRRRTGAVAAGAPARPKPPRDYDDEDDRPRKRKKKKSNNGLLIGLIIGGVLLLGGGVTLILVLTSEGDNRKGGGGFGPGPGGRPGAGGGPGLGGHTVDREDLRQIAMAFHDHCDAKRGPPRSAEDLVPYLAKRPSAIAPLRDGRLVFKYNVSLQDMLGGAGATNTVLAYERDAPARGGLVLFGDGAVRPVDAGEFARLEQARPRNK